MLHGDTDVSYTWKRKALELVEEEEEEEEEEDEYTQRERRRGGKRVREALAGRIRFVNGLSLTTKLYEQFIALESTDHRKVRDI